MSNEITVTLPLKQYNEMLREAKVNHVKNFIHKKYMDFDKNIYEVVADQGVIESRFGQTLQGADFWTQQENARLHDLLKDISETPITRGIGTVEKHLQDVVEKAKLGLRY